jgi:hypothetical protein
MLNIKFNSAIDDDTKKQRRGGTSKSTRLTNLLTFFESQIKMFRTIKFYQRKYVIKLFNNKNTTEREEN